MIMSGFLIAVASLLLCQAAVAQTSARIDWYGVYTTSSTKEVNDPTSPTGKRFISTPVPPKSNSNRIPGKNDIRFGYAYTITGQTGARINVKHVFRFPGAGMPDIVAGGRRTTSENLRTNNSGESVLIGWSFGSAPPERILIGDWVMEVWSNNRKLVEKRFTVYRP